MRTLPMSPARTARAVLGLAAVMVVLAACADKAFTPAKAAINPRMRLMVTANAAQQVAPAARYLWVAAAAVIPGGDTGLLAMLNVPVTGGTQTVTLNVDISRCLSETAAKGQSGCSIIIAATLRGDTISAADTSNLSPFARAFDYVLMGPYDVSSGRAPVIPPIDLSVSRFSIFDWAQDEALRLGGAQNVVVTGGTPIGRVLAGTTSGTGNPVLYTVSQANDFSTFTSGQPNQQFPLYPALGIFENGLWRRALATNTPAISNVNTGSPQGFMDVTALAANDVYIAATSGLYKYDGAAFSKITAVTDTLYSVASAPLAGGGRVVIAGGPSGVVWIGYGTSWQRYATGSPSRFDGVCITGPSEAFASSNVTGALYRFNGSTWTSVPTPGTGPKQDLQCPAPGVAYVSASGSGLFRWTASGWTPLGTGGLNPARNARIAVVSPTEIYAAGDSGATDRAFYRFDGSAWTEIGRRRFVQSPLKVWADPRGGAAYIFSAFGRLEKMTPSSVSVLSYQPALRDVVMSSANSGFAVGWNLFLARWDGVKWTVDGPPSGTPTIRFLQGVWSDGPSNAWAVGNSSTILRYNGSAWSVVSDVGHPVSTVDNYNGVWGSGSDVWIAGEATLLHCRAASTCVVESSGGNLLYSLWGSSPTNIFAVGSGGRILRYNGTSWSPMTSPTSRALARVAGSGANDVWAVGDSVLVHFDGTQWTNFPMNGDLHWFQSHVPSLLQGVFQLGLWVGGPKEAYLGGDGGIIARWNGAEWRQTDNGQAFRRRILSITGAGGCAMAANEGQTDSSWPTMWRGVGTAGCMSAAMGTPASWP